VSNTWVGGRPENHSMSPPVKKADLCR